jgi:hypothetical protein
VDKKSRIFVSLSQLRLIQTIYIYQKKYICRICSVNNWRFGGPPWLHRPATFLVVLGSIPVPLIGIATNDNGIDFGQKNLAT